MKKNVSTENVALLTVWNIKFLSAKVLRDLFSVNQNNITVDLCYRRMTESKVAEDVSTKIENDKYSVKC